MCGVVEARVGVAIEIRLLGGRIGEPNQANRIPLVIAIAIKPQARRSEALASLYLL
jgi:hypothetical protein